VFSNGSITTKNTEAPVSGSPFASASLNAMAEESGSNPSPGKAQPSSSPSRNQAGESSRKRLNLLLAEDNLPDALLVREAIHLAGLPLDVHAATDGEGAVAFIERAEEDSEAPRPDVILVDLNLPKVDGFGVLRRVRASEKYKDVPVLIITSSDSPADRNEGAKLDAGYFRKPADYEEFLKIGSVLKDFLEKKGVLKLDDIH
jgi:chemotaxis family two-component system response regulator Rcp1